MSERDGHIRVLPLHVANKIAAGEVVERPASVLKELVENAIDAGSGTIRISVTQGGRKLVSVQDDGCGMTRDDAILAFERQATSKILDVDDIENIDTLGFRGEAIPSIASVSRFTMTTRRHESDEGTEVQVNAGTIADVRTAGCPPGTLIEVRDLFCNVPVRRKFLRAYATEEAHIKTVFTIHALAHPSIAFSLVCDGRETYRLSPSGTLDNRVRDLFGEEFLACMLPLEHHQEGGNSISVTGYVERPNPSTPTRRDQYVFINGRPATAPSIAYAIREAYPRHQGDVRPAAIIFITLPPNQVDVNVHPTKREVRFRNNAIVKSAITEAIEKAVRSAGIARAESTPSPPAGATSAPPAAKPSESEHRQTTDSGIQPTPYIHRPQTAIVQPPAAEKPQPVQVEFAVEPDSTKSRPWVWFKFLATTDSGYLLIETDSGLVTINPHAARERITYETLLGRNPSTGNASQALLIPEMIHLSPPDFARISASIAEVRGMGFSLEAFGSDTFKVDEVPQIIGDMSVAGIMATIAHDLAEGPGRRGGERWRDELIAKSIARSSAGMSLALDEKGATRMVEELAACQMPYVCPRGKPIMIFTSTRELDRRFARN